MVNFGDLVDGLNELELGKTRTCYSSSVEFRGERTVEVNLVLGDMIFVLTFNFFGAFRSLN